MSLYQRILGHPFIYDRIRPWVVGGIDWTPLYRNLQAGPDDVVLDVGCGTGIALEYLKQFRAYHGYDTDEVAIEHARNHRSVPGAHFTCGLLRPEEFATIAPSHVLLSGLLHHLSDADAVSLLRMCASGPVRRIATSDPVYLPGELVGNVLAFLDRGKFVRKPAGYLEVIRAAGLEVLRDEVVRSHPKTGNVKYFMTVLAPRQSAQRN